MNTKYWMIIVAALLATEKLSAQSGKASSFSKLYFPFDGGIVAAPGNGIKSGSIIKTGIEYRPRTDRGLYIRFNFDSRSNNYEISSNEKTNVVKDKLHFTDYLIGVGYRLDAGNRFRFIGLLQSGTTTYAQPSVSGYENNYLIEEKNKTIPIIKFTTGIEYYISKNAALTLEGGYIYHLEQSGIWKDDLKILGISLGLTTTLF